MNSKICRRLLVATILLLVCAMPSHVAAQDYRVLPVGRNCDALSDYDKSDCNFGKWMREGTFKTALEGNANGMWQTFQNYEESIDNRDFANYWLKQAADRGHKDAMAKLGYNYMIGGRKFPQDATAAMAWMQKAYDAGSSEATGWLGMMYGGLQGFPKDLAKSGSLYCKLTDGDSYVEGGLRMTAAKKCAEAWIYGDGVAKNGAKAVQYYQKGIDNSVIGSKGEYDLRIALATLKTDGGVGYPADVQGAEAMLPAIINELQGNEANKLTAEINRDVNFQLGRVYSKNGTPLSSKQRAITYYLQSNSIGGKYNAAWHMAYDTGAVKDEVRARQLFLDAASEGHIGAMLQYGIMSASGLGGPKDIPTALRYYKLAADKGNADAASNYAWELEQSGNGSTPDWATIIAYYRKALDAGNGYGALNLGRLHSAGKGVAHDRAEALRLLNLAKQKASNDQTLMKFVNDELAKLGPA